MAYEAATARCFSSVSVAHAYFAHSAIANRSGTWPVKRCLHVEHEIQGAKVGPGGAGAGATSADLTRHATCTHHDEPRHVHPRRSGSAASPRSRQNRQRALSDAPPLMHETRASARGCTSRSVSRRARASPVQAFLCPLNPSAPSGTLASSRARGSARNSSSRQSARHSLHRSGAQVGRVTYHTQDLQLGGGKVRWRLRKEFW